MKFLVKMLFLPYFVFWKPVFNFYFSRNQFRILVNKFLAVMFIFLVALYFLPLLIDFVVEMSTILDSQYEVRKFLLKTLLVRDFIFDGLSFNFMDKFILAQSIFKWFFAFLPAYFFSAYVEKRRSVK